LPFGDGVFDIVVSVYCLRHVSDLDKALEEISRVLKGSILILEPLDENAFDYLSREVRMRSG
jgi:ubiquinone/menaquinone biosynthesis C-methylase UbiE